MESDGIIIGSVAIAPQGGKYSFILCIAKSITPHETVTARVRGSPAASAISSLETAPENAAIAISSTASLALFFSFDAGFVISEKPTRSGGAIKNI